jgi:hypothetical protein
MNKLDAFDVTSKDGSMSTAQPTKTPSREAAGAYIPSKAVVPILQIKITEYLFVKTASSA